MSLRVELTWAEMTAAATVGSMRNICALKKGYPDQHGLIGPGWTQHIEGACGECAFAKATNRYWSASINTFKAPDVGDYYVRTRSENHYELNIRPNDPIDAPFVLVTGVAPHFRVIGWIIARDARRPEWMKEYGGRPGAWFVPQSALLPAESLINAEIVRSKGLLSEATQTTTPRPDVSTYYPTLPDGERQQLHQ